MTDEGSCASCHHAYGITAQLNKSSLRMHSPEMSKNLPLKLPCDHIMCQSCIVGMIQSQKKVRCSTCIIEIDMKTDSDQLIQYEHKLHKQFPVTMKELKIYVCQEASAQQEIINPEIKTEIGSIQGQCVECSEDTPWICKICVTTLCLSCFKVTHDKHVTFKDHMLINNDFQSHPNTCSLHIRKKMHFYCYDCQKPICVDCMVDDECTCRDHSIFPIETYIESIKSELRYMYEKLYETTQRLKITANEIEQLQQRGICLISRVGSMLKKCDEVDEQYENFISILQQQRDDAKSKVFQIFSENKSLINAKSQINDSINKTKIICSKLLVATNDINNKQHDLPALLNEATAALNTPWCLKEVGTSEDTLKVTVNEGVYSTLQDLVRFEGDFRTTKYELSSESEENVIVSPAPPLSKRLKFSDSA